MRNLRAQERFRKQLKPKGKADFWAAERFKITSSTAYRGTLQPENGKQQRHPATRKRETAEIQPGPESTHNTAMTAHDLSFWRAVISSPESFGVIARKQVARWTGPGCSKAG